MGCISELHLIQNKCMTIEIQLLFHLSKNRKSSFLSSCLLILTVTSNL